MLHDQIQSHVHHPEGSPRLLKPGWIARGPWQRFRLSRPQNSRACEEKIWSTSSLFWYSKKPLRAGLPEVRVLVCSRTHPRRQSPNDVVMASRIRVAHACPRSAIRITPQWTARRAVDHQRVALLAGHDLSTGDGSILECIIDTRPPHSHRCALHCG